jgi:hypothetical protein
LLPFVWITIETLLGQISSIELSRKGEGKKRIGTARDTVESREHTSRGGKLQLPKALGNASDDKKRKKVTSKESTTLSSAKRANKTTIQDNLLDCRPVEPSVLVIERARDLRESMRRNPGMTRICKSPLIPWLDGISRSRGQEETRMRSTRKSEEQVDIVVASEEDSLVSFEITADADPHM